MAKLKTTVAVCLILVTTSVAFLPSLRNGFVNWDDDVYLYENNKIKTLSIGSIKRIFFSFHEKNYHPLSLLSYALEYRFFKLNPFVYHINNLLLHLINSLLVFWLIFLLSGRIVVAFVTAILFGIHPIHVESVAWISERRDVLYSAFFLGSIIYYLYYIRDKVRKYYIFSLILFVLSLLSKAMAITLPFVLLLCEFLINRKLGRENLIKKIPFFVIACVFGIITIFARYTSKDITWKVTFEFFYNICIASYSLLFYLIKMVAPLKFSAVYLYPHTAFRELPPVLSLPLLISPGIILILSMAVALSVRYTKKIIFGSLFFLITISPVLQLLRSVTSLTAADRYTYIPLIGIFYIIGEGFFWIYDKKSKSSKIFKTALVIILIAAIGILSFLAWNRCKAWKDSLSLWNDVIKNYPNVATAYNNRGAVFLQEKEYDKAYSDFIQTINIDPDFYEAYVNLCSLYNSLGNYNAAIESCNKATKIKPDFGKAYFNLGVTYSLIGKNNEAILSYKKAILVDPSFVESYIRLAVLYGNLGNHAEAMNLCKKAVELMPDSADAYYNLCSAYGNIGSFKEAAISCQKALKINPNLALAHFNLAMAYYYTIQYDLAVKHCDQAVKLGFKVSPEFLALLKPYRK